MKLHRLAALLLATLALILLPASAMGSCPAAGGWGVKKMGGSRTACDIETDQAETVQEILDIHAAGLSTGGRILYETLALKEVTTISGFTDKFFSTSAGTTQGGTWEIGLDANDCLSRAGTGANEGPCLTTDKMETECVDDDNCILKDGDTWSGATNFNDGIQLVPTSAATSAITLMLSGEIPEADGGTLPIIDCTGQTPGDANLNVTPAAASGKVLIQNLVFVCDEEEDVVSPEDLSDTIFLNVEANQEIDSGTDPASNAAFELPATDAYTFLCINCTGSAINYAWMRMRGDDADSKATLIGGSGIVHDDRYDMVGVITIENGVSPATIGDFAVIGTTVSVEDAIAGTGNVDRFGLWIASDVGAGVRVMVAGLTVDGIDTTDGGGKAYGVFSEGQNATPDYTLNLYATVVKDILSAADEASGVYIEGSTDPADTRTVNILGLVTENIISTGGTERGVWAKDFNEVTDPTLKGTSDCLYSHPFGGANHAWRCENCVSPSGTVDFDYDTCAELSDPVTGWGAVTSVKMGERCGVLPATDTYLIGGSGNDANDPAPGKQAAGECDRAINIRLPVVIPDELGVAGGTEVTHLMFHNEAEIRRIVGLCRNGGCQ